MKKGQDSKLKFLSASEVKIKRNFKRRSTFCRRKEHEIFHDIYLEIQISRQKVFFLLD